MTPSFLVALLPRWACMAPTLVAVPPSSDEAGVYAELGRREGKELAEKPQIGHCRQVH